MRSLTAYTSAEIAKAVTRPFYVAKLGFNTTLKLSSRGTITIGADTFTANGFALSAITKTKGGKLTGKIKISNHDLVMSGVILNQGVKNKSFQLYALYGAGPWVADDMTLLFDGVMDGVPAIGTHCEISFVTGSLATQRSPRLTFSSPVFNHCPPPGTVISWDDDRKILDEPREYTPRPIDFSPSPY